MRILAAGLVLLVASCQHHEMIHTHGMDLTDRQRAALEQKAAAGDSHAAWELYTYYSLEHHNEGAATPYIYRAAELGHPQAQRLLAYLIKEYEYKPAPFGLTAQQAVKRLLERSARTEGNAARKLADAFDEGYFGRPNHPMARHYYAQGALLNNRMSWKDYSRYLRNGIGGPRDDASAYYWIALETRCVDPRSISGKESWTAREEIATHLSLPVLEQQWARIDTFMARVDTGKIEVDSIPFSKGAIAKKDSTEGRRLAQAREDEHRRAHRQPVLP